MFKEVDSPSYTTAIAPMPVEARMVFPTPSSSWMSSFINNIFDKLEEESDPGTFVAPRVAYKREFAGYLSDGEAIDLNGAAIEQTLINVGAPANNGRLLIEIFPPAKRFALRAIDAQYNPTSKCVQVTYNQQNPSKIEKAITHELKHYADECRGKLKPSIIHSTGVLGMKGICYTAPAYFSCALGAPAAKVVADLMPMQTPDDFRTNIHLSTLHTVLPQLSALAERGAALSLSVLCTMAAVALGYYLHPTELTAQWAARKAIPGLVMVHGSQP